MSKGGGGTQTITSEIPKEYKDFANESLTLAGTVGNQAYIPYGSQRIAGFNADDNASFDAIRNLPSQYQQNLGQAGNVLTTLSNNGTGMSVPQVNAQQISGIPDVTAQQIVAQLTGAQTGAENMTRYSNPYENQVVNQTIADMGRANQIAQGGLNATAAGAGAYGGARHGIANAEMDRNYLDRAAAAAGGLRQQGFGLAAGLGQTDASRFLQSDTGNANRGLAAGQSNQQASLQASLANQKSAMESARANQLAALQAQTANAGNALSNAQLQSQTRLSAATGLRGLAGEQTNLALASAGARGQAGDMQRGMDQQNLDLAYGDFLEQQNYPLRQLSVRQSALGQTPMGSTQRMPVQSSFGSTASGIGSLLGGAAKIGTMIGMCWVAREVYGVDDVRWLVFRDWLLNSAPAWFRRLYTKHGERFAAYISDKPMLKRAVQAAMDLVVRPRMMGHELMEA